MTTLKGPAQPRYVTGIGTLALPYSSSGRLPTCPIMLKRRVWLEIAAGRIAHISAEDANPPPDAVPDNTFDAQGSLITPGFVDAHTHPAFVDCRSGEFVKRCRGETYQQIAAAGGGILSSMRAVRAASEEELTTLVEKRFRRFLELGVTTIEAKSGYGLTVEDELKSLRAIKKAAQPSGLDCCPTLLGAHTVPPEFVDKPDDYVKVVADEMIPRAAKEGLAEAVDVFVERSAFNVEQARRVLEAGRSAGLKLRLHTDQFTSLGGVRLAVEYEVASVDHCDYISAVDIKLLAAAGIPIVLLPGAVFFLDQERYADARQMVDSGCCIALSTDFNPGSSPTQSLPLIMTLACLKMRLTPAEALWAATLGGAYALGRQSDVGTLFEDFQADFCLWDAPEIDYIPYTFGDQRPAAVFKKGMRFAE
ncbi:MAG: imidazolonepropionase [Calditrichaeota bacterium]|nr:imidazolonepropionase [Calditrichota bacterium]